MKKYVFLLIYLLTTTCGIAQNRYSIFSLSGDIKYKSKNGLEWVKAKKKMPLELGDYLNIPRDGNVSILDNNTRCVHYSLREGSYKVITIITDALKNKSSLMKRLGEEIIKDTSPSSPKQISFRPIGGVKMGNSCLEDSIASFLFMFFNYEADRSPIKVNSQLLLRKEYITKDYLTFEITNNSTKGYYFNIARFDRDRKKIYICYNISETINDEGLELSLFIPSKETLSFRDFPFAASKKEEFLLFAIDRDFSVEALQSILDEGSNSGSKEIINLSSFCVGTDMK